MNFDDEYATKGDLWYEVGRLERQLRDSEEKIDELKQQIWELERNVDRLDSARYHFGCFFYLSIPITLLIAWFWSHS